MLEQRVIQPKYQKWISKLMGYSFEVIYKPGLENKAADALSRVPPTVHLNQLTAPYIIDVAMIKEEVNQDEKFKKIREELAEKGEEQSSKYSMKQGMLMYKNQMVISKTSKLIPMILHTFHDSGFLQTYKRLTGELYWEGMKQDVKKYCEECMICQRNKTLALSPARLLIPLEVPNRVWEDISMDFVEGLPKVNGFEVILVVVDRFSKYGHFLPLKHPYNAKFVAELFVKEVV